MTRKRTKAPNAPTRKVKKTERLTRLRVTLSRDSQPAWSLTRRHWQRLVVDLMTRFRDPVHVIQFAKRSRSRIVRSFVRSVEFPLALTPLSLTDSAENRAIACIP